MTALLHPFADPHSSEDAFINIVKAEGSSLWDDTGKHYIDALASLWYCQVGHARQPMIDAITRQLNTLDTYNIFAPFTNDVAAAAAEDVVAVSPHPDGKVFFGCSGSEAIDTALKLARLIPQAAGDHDRQIIVKRTHGYHGTNFGGTSAQGIAPNREGFGDLVPHFVEVASDDIEAMATVFAEHGPRIAAVLSEPVQGAGGVFTPSDGYLEGLRRLCDDNGSLLIFDEVICGFGRTGEWFASQTYGVTPDMITFAKGVTSGYQPVSGVIVSKATNDKFDVPLLRHGYTYSGHPSCTAAVTANINLLREENLIERARHLGTLFADGLGALASDGIIESYRGVGAIWAADLGDGVDSIPVRNRMIDAGTVVRGIGSAIAFCPPLIATEAEVGQMIDTLAQCRHT